MPVTSPVHLSVCTSDLQVARREVGRLFGPHHLRATRSGIRMRLCADRIRSIGVIELDYGNRVRIDAAGDRDYFLVQVPRDGRARVAQGTEQIASTCRMASVLSPHEPVSMIWDQGNPQLIFFAERRTLEAELAALIGRPLDRPLQFALGMQVSQPAQQAWLRTLQHLREEIRLDSPLISHPAILTQLEHTLLTGLLISQPHNYHDALPAEGSFAAAVGRATAYMESHIDEPLTLPQVAAATGCGVRALQKGFRAETDTTPMSWLRQRRMELAHQRLRQADPNTCTVTKIAHGLGITHLGRFAVEYRERFGESPSATLQDRCATPDPGPTSGTPNGGHDVT